MVDMGHLIDRLGGRAELDATIGSLTTYGVGGPAAVLVRADAPGDLEDVAAAVAGTDVPVLVIGRGSNLLVHDDGFSGVVVALGDGFSSVRIEGTEVRAGGAASLPVVARRTATASLTGFEWAVGVPGSIGGAVRMNAGGHGSDMAAVVVSAEIVDLAAGGRRTLFVDELAFGYRASSIAAAQVVVEATLGLRPGDRQEAEAEIAEIVRWRRAHQPGGHNAGSVFVNPPDDSAGRLIEAVGGKGMRVGTAEISTKHANFIQVDDGGSAADVYALMVKVRDLVDGRTGIRLAAETHLVGFAPLDSEPTTTEGADRS